MTEPHTTVKMVEYGHGPRHLRLRAIWDAIDRCTPEIELDTDGRKYGSHQEAFETFWAEGCSTRYMLLTEEDFLPDLETDWLNQQLLQKYVHLVACQYRMRDSLRSLAHPDGTVGGWYLSFDMAQFERPVMRGESALVTCGSRPLDFGGRDCGNRLQEQVEKVQLFDGSDGRFNHKTSGVGTNPVVEVPNHFGIEYPFGVHLFWSRHLHDDPRRRISGIELGDIQAAHDKRVDYWLATAPERFHRIYKEGTRA